MIQSGNAADINADFGEVWYRIHVEAGVNGADIQCRRSQISMRRDVELKCFQSGEHARGFIGGVDTEVRHRSMGGDALEGQAQPERAQEPPAEYPILCGLCTGPVALVWLPPERQKYSQWTLPTMVPPASRMRVTMVASMSGM